MTCIATCGVMCSSKYRLLITSKCLTVKCAILYSMGSCCCKLLRRQRRDAVTQAQGVIGLREDPLHYHYPVECTDEGESQLAHDFVDLRLDVFPVQCTEPPAPNVPYCINTITVYIDILMREFHASY